MSDEPDLAEQLLDLMVYIPLGLALEARDLLPKLAERGRGQVALVRFAGKVASERGRRESEGLLDQVVATVGTLLAGGESQAPTTRAQRPSRGSDDADLPIDGYDTLSAPQLLPHLEPLAPDELAEVLAYEEDHRGRATVINRIRQLQT